jgi:TniQ
MTAEMIVTLDRQQRESPRSFLARLAEANRVFPLLGDVLLCPARSAALLVDEPNNRGVTINWENKASAANTSNTSMFVADVNGTQMGTSLFRSSFRPLCPKCLAENEGTTLLLWEFKRIQGCATHHCALLERCPSCHEKFTWLFPLRRHCPCGFDIALASTKSLAPPSQSFVTLFDEVISLKPGSRCLGYSTGLEYVAGLQASRFQLILEVIEDVLIPMYWGCARGVFVKKHGQGFMDSIALEILNDDEFLVMLEQAIQERAGFDPQRESEKLTPGQEPGQVASWFEPALRRLPVHDAIKRLGRPKVERLGRLKKEYRWCNFSWQFKRADLANKQFSERFYKRKGYDVFY